MTAQFLAMDTFWVDKSKYDEAEAEYYTSIRNAPLTPLADEVAKARQRLIQIRDNFDEGSSVIKDVNAPVKGSEPGSCNTSSMDPCAVKFLEKKVNEFQDVIMKIQSELSRFDARLASIETNLGKTAPKPVCQKPAAKPVSKEDDDDDDVDLFGSESEDDEAAAKVKEERLAAYNAKKSKKPALIAKSSIILDIKPWDDETDMKAMEAEVRKIEMDGLLWGASKLVPLAYGIHKLQVNCVVEDEKVSIDELQEKIETIEDFVQSVDIAAFNKI